MNGEVLRLVDSIHRDKNIDREVIISGIEQALLSALRKHFGGSADITISIDRETGEIGAYQDSTPITPVELGRIAAQSAKQVIIQKIREAEADVIYIEYNQKVGTIVTGTVQRFEGPNMVVNLGRVEAFMPRFEQIPTETYQPGDRLRALVVDARRVGSRASIVLSRTHPDFIRRLFEIEVPEISDHTIEINAVAREPGHRTKIAVSSNDSKVDCMGACVGVRGSRVRSITDELNGEKVDIIRYSEEPDVFVSSCLKPAEVEQISLDPDNKKAVVVVPQDQLSLAIGKKGQNVRLAARLTGWDIDIVASEELALGRDALLAELAAIPGVTESQAAALYDAGVDSARDILELGTEQLARKLGTELPSAEEMINYIKEQLPEGEDHLPAYNSFVEEAATKAQADEIAESQAPEPETEQQVNAEESPKGEGSTEGSPP